MGDEKSSRLTVLVGEDVGEVNLGRLRAAFPEVVFRLGLSDEAFLAAAPEADIFWSKHLPAGAVARATRLRWVQAGTAGIEHFLNAGLREHPAVLTNSSGAHGIPMAEQILAMMLAFATGINTLIRAQSGHTPVHREVIRTKFELEGQTLLVIGLGDIGGTLARKALALGLRVLGIRRSRVPFPGLHAQYTPDERLQALPQADHVALCLPNTKATHAIISERELHAMRPTAYLYNVGRGAAIDPQALQHALQQGWIAGAGLDVTAPEPLPADSPLWDLPNVILGQHTSGSSPRNAERITALFQENLARYLRGEPLQQVVDKQAGY